MTASAVHAPCFGWHAVHNTAAFRTRQRFQFWHGWCSLYVDVLPTFGGWDESEGFSISSASSRAIPSLSTFFAHFGHSRTLRRGIMYSLYGATHTAQLRWILIPSPPRPCLIYQCVPLLLGRQHVIRAHQPDPHPQPRQFRLCRAKRFPTFRPLSAHLPRYLQR